MKQLKSIRSMRPKRPRWHFDPQKGNLIPISKFIPSLITVSSLCMGLTAIKFALLHDFAMAIKMLLIAAILDGIDGRIARALRSTSQFGAELDSLCDMVNFGIAPGLLLYIWGLKDYGFLGWSIVLFLAVCTVIRLARFNILIADEKTDKNLQKGFFVGVPSTIGGLLSLLPINLYDQIETLSGYSKIYVIPFLFFIGCLMVSRIPTISTKNIHINRQNVLLYFMLTIVVIMALINEVTKTLIVLSFLYLLSIPWSIRDHMKYRVAFVSRAADKIDNKSADSKAG